MALRLQAPDVINAEKAPIRSRRPVKNPANPLARPLLLSFGKEELS